MRKYRCTIVETLKLWIEIEADDKEEAIEKLINGYHNEEFVLSSDDYFDTDFYCEDIERSPIEQER